MKIVIVTIFMALCLLPAYGNHNLEEQAKAIYATYFPYSVDDALPDDWRKGTLGKLLICMIQNAFRCLVMNVQRWKKSILTMVPPL